MRDWTAGWLLIASVILFLAAMVEACAHSCDPHELNSCTASFQRCTQRAMNVDDVDLCEHDFDACCIQADCIREGGVNNGR